VKKNNQAFICTIQFIHPVIPSKKSVSPLQKLLISKNCITVPSGLLQTTASIIYGVGKLIGKSFDGIHPDRVKKLMISTNINGQKLLDHGYKMEDRFEEAIADWYEDCNKEGLY